MFEALLLGTIQGIFEWLPVSSEGMIVLVQTNFFGADSVYRAIDMALFLHLGTVMAALVYFRREVLQIIFDIFSWEFQKKNRKNEIWFYGIATIMSGVIGYVLLQVVKTHEAVLAGSGFVINLIIAGLLLFTGILQLWKRHQLREEGTTKMLGRDDVTMRDTIITGIAQGITPLPGVSRSGTTTATLLLLGISEMRALELSFILSIPIVLIANVVLAIERTHFDPTMLLGLITSFVFGLLTIHVLLRIAKRVNFGWFVIGFAVVIVVATFFL